ncbi:unnamed protein product [Ilex paraguariensis]|uniref:Uncharacterized protein n=1 Tax=Ilex paraguariensis TaxID=185542 RepID=A0ABC8QVC9_9AQUA
MATGLSHSHLLSIHTPQHSHNYSCFCDSTNLFHNPQILVRIPNFSAHLRTVPKSLPRKNLGTPLETSTPQSKPPISDNRLKSPDPNPHSDSSFFNLFFLRLQYYRKGLRFDALGLEILSIALPAALALAADPIASLVDTAFVGHLGSVELAAVGVSISVFNLVSKLFNIPLLNITTSFVAEEQALVNKSTNVSNQIVEDRMAEPQSKIQLPSVSTSLALAAGLGIAEAIVLSAGVGFFMNTMGIPVMGLFKILMLAVHLR